MIVLRLLDNRPEWVNAAVMIGKPALADPPPSVMRILQRPRTLGPRDERAGTVFTAVG